MTQERFSQHAPTGRGLAGDLGRIKRDGTATAAELQKFLQDLKGKSPQEVLGSVAQSRLLQSVVQASLWSLVLIGVFTAGPYLWAKMFPNQPGSSTAAASQPAETQPEADPTATTSAQSDKQKPATAVPPDSPAAGREQEILDKL